MMSEGYADHVNHSWRRRRSVGLAFVREEEMEASMTIEVQTVNTRERTAFTSRKLLPLAASAVALCYMATTGGICNAGSTCILTAVNAERRAMPRPHEVRRSARQVARQRLMTTMTVINKDDAGRDPPLEPCYLPPIDFFSGGDLVAPTLPPSIENKDDAPQSEDGVDDSPLPNNNGDSSISNSTTTTSSTSSSADTTTSTADNNGNKLVALIDGQLATSNMDGETETVPEQPETEPTDTSIEGGESNGNAIVSGQVVKFKQVDIDESYSYSNKNSKKSTPTARSSAPATVQKTVDSVGDGDSDAPIVTFLSYSSSEEPLPLAPEEQYVANNNDTEKTLALVAEEDEPVDATVVMTEETSAVELNSEESDVANNHDIEKTSALVAPEVDPVDAIVVTTEGTSALPLVSEESDLVNNNDTGKTSALVTKEDEPLDATAVVTKGTSAGLLASEEQAVTNNNDTEESSPLVAEEDEPLDANVAVPNGAMADRSSETEEPTNGNEAEKTVTVSSQEAVASETSEETVAIETEVPAGTHTDLYVKPLLANEASKEKSTSQTSSSSSKDKKTAESRNSHNSRNRNHISSSKSSSSSSSTSSSKSSSSRNKSSSSRSSKSKRRRNESGKGKSSKRRSNNSGSKGKGKGKSKIVRRQLHSKMNIDNDEELPSSGETIVTPLLPEDAQSQPTGSGSEGGETIVTPLLPTGRSGSGSPLQRTTDTRSESGSLVADPFQESTDSENIGSTGMNVFFSSWSLSSDTKKEFGRDNTSNNMQNNDKNKQQASVVSSSASSSYHSHGKYKSGSGSRSNKGSNSQNHKHNKDTKGTRGISSGKGGDHHHKYKSGGKRRRRFGRQRQLQEYMVAARQDTGAGSEDNPCVPWNPSTSTTSVDVGITASSTSSPNGAPQLSTSMSPTTSPSVSPTKSPKSSLIITSAPTVSRTESPTSSPTVSRTENPTPSPETGAPTLLPSPSPSTVWDPICNQSVESRNTAITQIVSGVGATSASNSESLAMETALDWILEADLRHLCLGDTDTSTSSSAIIQRYVLATFYFVTNGGAWTDCSAPSTENDPSSSSVCFFGGASNTYKWLSSANECDWYGMTCNANGFVTELDLEENNLGNSIPSTLSELSELSRIKLDENNNITGSIPTSLGGMARLKHLDLSQTSLSGVVPEDLVNLPSLDQLVLYGTSITAPLPEGICTREIPLSLFIADCSVCENSCCTHCTTR